MRRLSFIAAAFGLLLTVSCRDDPPPKPPAPPVVEEPVVVPAETPHPLALLRQAYGLPFPPEVLSVRQGSSFIEVGTKLSVSDLEKFFKGRLVDYEFVRPSPNDMHIIGLRSTMPRILVTARGVRDPVAVRYVQQIGALERQKAPVQAQPKPKPGQRVETTLGDGRQLAPGAVYGQPYTPKPGDPLYSERHRANFGKPYGQWILN